MMEKQNDQLIGQFVENNLQLFYLFIFTSVSLRSS